MDHFDKCQKPSSKSQKTHSQRLCWRNERPVLRLPPVFLQYPTLRLLSSLRRQRSWVPKLEAIVACLGIASSSGYLLVAHPRSLLTFYRFRVIRWSGSLIGVFLTVPRGYVRSVSMSSPRNFDSVPQGGFECCIGSGTACIQIFCKAVTKPFWRSLGWHGLRDRWAWWVLVWDTHVRGPLVWKKNVYSRTQRITIICFTIALRSLVKMSRR